MRAATGIVSVDLAAIASNWKALAAKVGPAECAAVVKANAYGLGADAVIPALAAAGCKSFFIATPAEAESARTLAGDARIFALDGLIAGSARDFASLDVIPVLSTPGDVFAWRDQARDLGRRLPAAFHIDTGLHRLGLAVDDMETIAADTDCSAALDLRLVMSHLASADNPDDPKNAAQLAAFTDRTLRFNGVPRSLAASDGLMLGPAYHFDLVRPGYALYGGQASAAHPAPVQPAVSIKARILAVHDVAVGETVGYSATWKAERQTRIATVAAGYADGIPRNASAGNGDRGGHVVIAGVKVPIVGRVSMDLVTADVTGIDPSLIRVGDFATIVGDGISIEDAGFAADTIGYEILTRIGARFRREYTTASNTTD